MKSAVVRVVCVLLFLLQVATSFAQEQQSPPTPEIPLMGSEASPAPPDGLTAAAVATSDGDAVYRILVIGDALAGGLGAGMTRVVQDQAGYEILNRFNESSGLARREVYDWSAALSKIVATKSVDAVVVLVGMNDRQEIRDGNIRHVFRAPEWIKGYTGNVDRLIESVRAANAKLVWISVPPMANQNFDTDMRFLSDIHRQRVAAAAGRYVDVRPYFLAPDGSYLDRGIDDMGNERKLRDSDGIRFMKAGNNRFGQLVLETIKTLEKDGAATLPVVAATPAAIPAETTPLAAANPGVTIVTEPPSFGQDGLEGEDLVFRADSLKAPAPTQVSVTKRIAGQPQGNEAASELSARAGTEAEKLLTEGIVGKAPAGRFDDYSVPIIQ